LAKKRKRASKTVERERKFLVKELPARLSRYPHSTIEQGYLALAGEDHDATEIRVRRGNHRHVLTIKRGRGEARLEKEIPLSPVHARSLWPLTKGRRVKKVRYRIPYRGLDIELDVYRGHARGLAVAEVEFSSATVSRQFKPPPWFGKEVTGHKAFANSQLALTGWKRTQRTVT
jgi:CYTH domain-containing protein